MEKLLGLILPKMNTKLLVIGLRNSNVRAFGKLFELYQPKIKSFLLSKNLGNNIDDVIQETFITLWNKRETVDVTKSFDSYVLTIAKNHALKTLRKQLLNEVDASKTEIQDSSLIPESTIDLWYYEERVQSSINKLPPQPKTVFELKRREGMSTKQVALELGISPKTVENYMNKALATLRKELKDFAWLITFLILHFP